MAMARVNQRDQMTNEKTVEALEGNLKKSSRSMVQFSVNLKSLFNESQVTSNKQTEDFIELRDNTRKNAAVYTTKVLPLSESVVKKIGVFTDYFEHLEFEDWVECLDDLIKECTEGAADCDLLQQMHQGLIKSLKKDAGKAMVAKDTLELTAKKLKLSSKIDLGLAIGLGVCSVGLTVLTAGAAAIPISVVAVSGTVAAAGTGFVGVGVSKAVAGHQNATIARKNIDLTDSSIQAMESFISGLMGLSSFFMNFKTDLEKMKIHGEKGTKKPFYLMMKNVAKGIDGNCKLFLNVAELMRVELDSIPLEISDKNYVDIWLEEQKAEIRGGLSRPGWMGQHRSIADN